MDNYFGKQLSQQEMLKEYVKASQQEADVVSYSELIDKESSNYAFRDEEAIEKNNFAKQRSREAFQNTVLHKQLIYISPGTSEDADPFDNSPYEVDNEIEKEIIALEQKKEQLVQERDTKYENNKNDLVAAFEDNSEEQNKQIEQLQNKIDELKQSPKYLQYLSNKKRVEDQKLNNSKKVKEYYCKGKKLRGLEKKYAEIKKGWSFFSYFTKKNSERKDTKKKIKAERKLKRKKLMDFQAGSLSMVKGFISSVGKSKTTKDYIEHFDKQVLNSYVYKSNEEDIKIRKSKYGSDDEKALGRLKELKRGEQVSQSTNLFTDLFKKNENANVSNSISKEQLADVESNNLTVCSQMLSALLLGKAGQINTQDDISKSQTSLTRIKGMISEGDRVRLSSNSQEFIDLDENQLKNLACDGELSRMVGIVVLADLIHSKLDRDDSYTVNDVKFGDLDGIFRTSTMVLTSFSDWVNKDFSNGNVIRERINRENNEEVIESTENKKIQNKAQEDSALVKNILNNTETNVNNEKNANIRTIENVFIEPIKREKAFKIFGQSLGLGEKQNQELFDAFKDTNLYNDINNKFWNRIDYFFKAYASGKKESVFNSNIKVEFAKYLNTLLLNKVTDVMNRKDTKSNEMKFYDMYSKIRKERSNLQNRIKKEFEKDSIIIGDCHNIINSRSFKYIQAAIDMGDDDLVDTYLQAMKDQYNANVVALSKWANNDAEIVTSNELFITANADLLSLMNENEALAQAKLYFANQKFTKGTGDYKEYISKSLEDNKISERYYVGVLKRVKDALNEFNSKDDLLTLMYNKTFESEKSVVEDICKEVPGNIKTNMEYFQQLYANVPLKNSDWVRVKAELDIYVVYQPELFKKLVKPESDFGKIFENKVTVKDQIEEFSFTESIIEKWQEIDNEQKKATKKKSNNNANEQVIFNNARAAFKMVGFEENRISDCFENLKNALNLVLQNNKEALPEVVTNLLSFDEISELNKLDAQYLGEWIKTAILNGINEENENVIPQLFNKDTAVNAFVELLENGKEAKGLAKVIEKRLEYEKDSDKLNQEVADMKFSILVNEHKEPRALDFDVSKLTVENAKASDVLNRIEKFNKVKQFRQILRGVQYQNGATALNMEKIFDEMIGLFSSVFESTYEQTSANNYIDNISKKTVEAAEYENDYADRLRRFFDYLYGDKPTSRINLRIKARLDEDSALDDRFKALSEVLKNYADKKKQKDNGFLFNGKEFKNELCMLGYESSFLGTGMVEADLLLVKDESVYREGLHRISKNLSNEDSMLNYFKGSLSEEKITKMKQVEAVIKDQTSKDLFNRQYASKQLLYKIYVEGEIVKDSYEGFFNQLFGQKKIDLKAYFEFLEPLKKNVITKINNTYNAKDIDKTIAELKPYVESYFNDNIDKFNKVYVDNKALFKLQDEVNTLNPAIDTLKDEIKNAESINNFVNEYNQKLLDNQNIEKTKGDLVKENETLNSKISTESVSFMKISSELGMADNKDKPLNKKEKKALDKRQKDKDTLEAKIADLQKQLNENQIKIKNLDKNLSDNNNRINELKSNLSNYNVEEADYKKQAGILESKRTELKKKVDKLNSDKKIIQEKEKEKEKFNEFTKNIKSMLSNLADNLQKKFLSTQNTDNSQEKKNFFSEEKFEQLYGVKNYQEYAGKLSKYISENKKGEKTGKENQRYNSIVTTVEHARLNPYMVVLEKIPKYWTIMATSEKPGLDLQNLYDEYFKEIDAFFNGIERKDSNEKVVAESEKQLFIMRVQNDIIDKKFTNQEAINTAYKNFLNSFYNAKIGESASINANITKILKANNYSENTVKAFSDLSIMVTRDVEPMYVYYDETRLKNTIARYKTRRKKNWEIIRKNQNYLDLCSTQVPGTQNITYEQQLKAFLDTRVMECDTTEFASRIDAYVEYVKSSVKFNKVSDKKKGISRRDQELSLIEININSQQYAVEQQLKPENDYLDTARRLRNNKFSPVAYSKMSQKKKEQKKYTNLNSIKMFFISDMDSAAMNNSKDVSGFFDENPDWKDFICEMVCELNIGEFQTDSTVVENAKRVIEYIKALGKNLEHNRANEQKVMYFICQGINPDEVRATQKLYTNAKGKINTLRSLEKQLVSATDIIAELQDDISDFEYMLYAENDATKFDKIITKRIAYYTCLIYINTAANRELEKTELSSEQKQIVKKELEKMLVVNSLIADAYFSEEQINARVENILKDKNYCDVLIQRSGLRSYGSVSSDEVSKNEGAKTDVSLADFTKFLQEHLGESDFNKFMSLKDNQKKAFAIALALPVSIRVNDRLYSGKLIYENEKQEEDTNISNIELIARYLLNRAVEERVIFKTAMDRLMNNQGRVNKEIFNHATEVIDAYQRMLARYQERNWNVLNSPNDSAQIFRDSSPYAYKGNVNINNLDDFRKQMLDNLSQKSTLRKRIEGYNDEMLLRLVTALQNRTILDKPSSEKNDSSVVNEHMRRETFKQILNKDKNDETLKNSKAPKYLNRAFTTLLSCQIKEDISKDKINITENDLVKESFDRTTALDETLLENALNFVDTTAKYNKGNIDDVSAKYDKEYYNEEHKRSKVSSKYEYTVNRMLYQGELFALLGENNFDIFGNVTDFHKENAIEKYANQVNNDKVEKWKAIKEQLKKNIHSNEDIDAEFLRKLEKKQA